MADAITTLIQDLSARWYSQNDQYMICKMQNMINALQQIELGLGGPGLNAPANQFLGGATSGGITPAAFRFLTPADIPALAAANVPASAIAPSLGNSLSGRNKIINGDFRISQRNGTNSVTPTASGYVLDRWTMGLSQASKLTASQALLGAPYPSSYAMLINTAAAYTPIATDQFFIAQVIEAQNCNDTEFGSSGALPLTLSFWVFPNAISGPFGGVLGNPAANRSYPFTYNPPPNTFSKVVITIQGDTLGTWPQTGNGGGMTLYFDLGSGANFKGPAGAWAAGNFAGAIGTTNLVSQSASMYWTDIQLELAPPGATPANPIATSFERRQFGTELALCQRYFTSLSYGGNTRIATGQATGVGSVDGAIINLPTIMRANPTIVLPAAGTAAGQAAFFQANGTPVVTVGALATSGQPAPNSFSVDCTGAAGLIAGNASVLYTTAGCTFTASAEL